MEPAVLEARQVVKAYGRGPGQVRALEGVSLEIGSGESVAIVGRSGSGKSTLMHLLALLDTPTCGQVAFLGRPVSLLGVGELNRIRNESFGFVFQQFFLTAHQSVLENVVLPLRIAGVGRGERRRRGMAMLERLELAEKAGCAAVELSGGQKQRVAIARALINDPQVVFADEPTGNLDSATGAVVEDLLFALHREQGTTLVVVTHDEELAGRCDRQVRLRDGRVLPTGADPIPEQPPVPDLGHQSTPGARQRCGSAPFIEDTAAAALEGLR